MSKSWVLDVKECEDGSGDKYIELNDEILAELAANRSAAPAQTKQEA